MSYSQLSFNAAAREKVLRGATALADAIRVTLGPKSKSVLIGKRWGAPIVCNDGVTIAKQIELKDPEEALGARMMREVAERTGDAVGDGTTTAVVLAHAIFADGVRNVVAGASAIDLKRGLDRGLRVALDALKAQATPVRSRLEKAQVATISAHNDLTIGETVAQAIERVGSEGVITVEEAKATETTLEVVEGMQFDRGYLSPYFVTNQERMECVLENPMVFLSENKIVTMPPLIPLLEDVARGGHPLLIITEDVEGDALATLVVNKLRGTLPCAAVRAPGFGDRRRAMLEDIAVLTGAQIVSEQVGLQLENVKVEHLGRAARAIIAKDATTIVGGAGDAAAIKARIEQLRSQSLDAKSDYEREKLQERLGKLSGGVAVIHVGAPTEAEMKSRKEAFEDAVSATRAAIAEGIVPGGELALLRTIEAVEREESQCTGDERTGVRILRHALEAPTRQIAQNSGVDAGVVVERLRSGGDDLGFDASTGKYVGMREAGIIDPAKVVRIALENAVSLTGILLLTEVTLTEIPEETRERAPELQ